MKGRGPLLPGASRTLWVPFSPRGRSFLLSFNKALYTRPACFWGPTSTLGSKDSSGKTARGGRREHWCGRAPGQKEGRSPQRAGCPGS